MATHSSVLAWRITGTGEPGGLLSLGSHRVGHDWSDLAAAAAAVTTLVAQTVKCLPAMWETWVWFLGQEDTLERKWQYTPALLPGKSHGQRSLIGYSPWGHKESDMTERLHFHFSLSCPTLCDPMDCSPPGSSVHGVLLARILEWVAIPFSRGSSQPRGGIESPALQPDSLPSEPTGKPQSKQKIKAK